MTQRVTDAELVERRAFFRAALALVEGVLRAGSEGVGDEVFDRLRRIDPAASPVVIQRAAADLVQAGAVQQVGDRWRLVNGDRARSRGLLARRELSTLGALDRLDDPAPVSPATSDRSLTVDPAAMRRGWLGLRLAVGRRLASGVGRISADEAREIARELGCSENRGAQAMAWFSARGAASDIPGADGWAVRRVSGRALSQALRLLSEEVLNG